MKAVAATRTWLHRLVLAVPFAWHHDTVFRWAAIGAGVALLLFGLRLAGPVFIPASSVPASLGPTYAASTARSPLAPPVSPILPKIAPGRSLEGVTITPAPEPDRFGTLSPATRQP
jgi:hypothetical protein